MTTPEAKPVRSETIRSIAGALRFCRFDRTAATAFDPSPATALRSFMAALYRLPFYVGVLALNLWQSAHLPDDLWLYGLIQLIAYVAHTAAFPLAVLALVRFLGHVAQWPLFVTAQNWFRLLQISAQLACLVLDRSGILGSVGTAVLVAVVLYSLFVEVFVSQMTLGVSLLASIAVVLLDIVIGVGIDQLTDTLF